MDLFSMSNSSTASNQLDLKRDIVFFDIESTGLNILKDRIIQLAMIKCHADGSPNSELEIMVNPGIPIPEDSQAIHGISDADVAGLPTFEAKAQEVLEFIGNADLAGYNSDRFDIPLLVEELYRHGHDLDLNARKCIDVQKIFYKMEPRTLKAAYAFYCDKKLENAHDALVDVKATVEVLLGMINKYKDQDYTDADGNVIPQPIQNDIDSLHKFTADRKQIDYTNRLKLNDKGEVIFNFGKYINRPVKEVFKRDRNYYHWIMDKDFSSQVKKISKQIMDGIIVESIQGSK